jgi:S1-C subfamily serine protease
VKLELLRGKDRKTVSVSLGTFQDESQEGEESESGRASLGMTLREVTPAIAERLELPRGTKGVVVVEVEAGTAAEDAQLVREDVIVSANGQAVETLDAFDKAIDAARPSGRIRLRVYNRQIQGYRVVVLRLK